MVYRAVGSCTAPKAPSAEGAVKNLRFLTGGEISPVFFIAFPVVVRFYSLPQSASLTAPSSEGAFDAHLNRKINSHLTASTATTCDPQTNPTGFPVGFFTLFSFFRFYVNSWGRAKMK